MLEKSILTRARMILLAFEKLQNCQIAEVIGVERHSIGRWRKRWQDSVDALLAIELKEPRAVLRRTIIDFFRDAWLNQIEIIFELSSSFALSQRRKPRQFRAISRCR